MSNRLPSSKEFEDRFTLYVRQSGVGERVDELVTRGAKDPLLADYLLWDRTVIAEMKCIVQDHLNSDGIGAKLQRVTEQLIRDGKAGRIVGTNRFKAPDLISQRRLWDAMSTPLKKPIQWASKQIRSTSKEFKLERFYGLLILVNLADRRLSPDAVYGMLIRTIREHPLTIHYVAFYSPHLGVRLEDGRPATLWISGMNGEQPSDIMERVNHLMEGWLRFNEGTYLSD